MTGFETLRLETDARGVATLTLNRPDRHNAMNAPMIAELAVTGEALARDPAVRVVVLRSEGPTFCAGGDLGWMREQMARDRAGKMAASRALATMLAILNGLPKPLIARVQGDAFGGGVGLLSVCDIAIAVPETRFALTETRLGLAPAAIGPFVVRRLGEGFARQMLLAGRPFDAAFALRAGLIAEIRPADALDEAVDRAATAALTGAPGAIADAKRFCLTFERLDPETLTEKTAALLADRWETREAADGIAAFFARKRPPWTPAD